MQPGFVLTLALPENDKLHDDKADTLEINGFGESHAFTLRPGQQPSTDMLAFLRLMNLGGAGTPSHACRVHVVALLCIILVTSMPTERVAASCGAMGWS